MVFAWLTLLLSAKFFDGKLKDIETRPDTQPGISRVRLGRGSKVVSRGGEEGRGGGAVCTTASVPIYWAGAVMQELLAFSWAGAVSPPSGGRGGRGGRGEGRGRVGCRILDNLSHMWLGGGGNA